MEPNDVFCFTDFETTGVTEHDYPIEVGVVFTDAKFNFLDQYEALVGWEDLLEDLQINGDNWPQYAKEAEKIHKISASTYKTNSSHIITVVTEINEKVHRYKKDNRVIIISDNAWFEMMHMKKLYDRRLVFPFHYCAWDTSLLIEGLNI